MIVDAAPCTPGQLVARLREWARRTDEALAVLVVDCRSVELTRRDIDSATDEQLLARLRRTQGNP